MPKPTLEELRAACPDAAPEALAVHRDRLDEDYFETFDPPDIGRHLQGLGALSPDNPVTVLLDVDEDRAVSCTVLGHDYPAEFSVIAGALTAVGLSVLSGRVFTYRPAAAPAACPPHPRGGRARRPRRPPPRRCIIDHFTGVVASEEDAGELAATLPLLLREAIGWLARDTDEGLAKARQVINERVAARLRRLGSDRQPLLFPVEIDVSNSAGPFTRLHVSSQDTPAFLYSLSNALSLRGISIEQVRIRTVHGVVEDELDVLDARGRKIVDDRQLDELKFSVLLTKQFTYFLNRAPDPAAALARFARLAEEIPRRPERGTLTEQFGDPAAMQKLARVLGASDFIWEDFIRTQYEELLRILDADTPARRPVFTREALRRRRDAALETEPAPDGRRAALNAWKDREILLVDIDHILHAGVDVRALAEPLTTLAELVVEGAVEVALRELEPRYGRPCTVGGLEVGLSVFGLGKLGGVALGYASDIELLFVYSDSGKTDGPESIENAEYFERVVEGVLKSIVTRREGIFRVDLRLRPHGKSGPRACSLESFCRYYGPGGGAHSYERLALTRLRHVAGDAQLGRQVERLRDEFVYESNLIRFDELQELRRKQFAEKAPPGGRTNAKFSPGALVDLEYCVQILQVMHGGANRALRTSRIHEALAALAAAGVLAPGEGRALTESYYFLRRLINGLRMLRGNALDLFLPAPDSPEYVHLARRMGYVRRRDLDPEEQLHVEFETHTARIRTFIERHFGRAALPGDAVGNVVDLVLSDDVGTDLRDSVLQRNGFRDPARAFVNLCRLAGDADRRELFARLVLLACDILRRAPDPDMALNNWEHFVDALPDVKLHFGTLLAQPRRMEILLGIFAGSQFLSDTLVRYPEFLDWVTNPLVLHGTRNRERLAEDLILFAPREARYDAWLDALRRFRRREVLRIGTRDMCLNAPLEEIVAGLSALAEALLGEGLEREWERLRAEGDIEPAADAERRFCLLALGKLGGRELNYSSDIDLVGVYDDAGLVAGRRQTADFCAKAFERLRSALSKHTGEGYAYRVDLRLRPHGRSGALVQPVSALIEYYSKTAAAWEVQALLKARPVAGTLEVGAELLESLRPVLTARHDGATVRRSIARMREAAVRRVGDGETDVKTGLGGIRDVEFLVQGLQLAHLNEHPELLEGNTLEAVDLLAKAGVLPEAQRALLRRDYALLRRVEHYLQILEDRQTHALPSDERQLAALAKRTLGEHATAEQFTTELAAAQHRVHAAYRRFVGETG